MNHHPFETWLLSDTAVTPQQHVELQQHLETCPDCRRLELGWKQARQQMLDAPMAAPRPGFGARFQASLAQRQEQHARRQALRLIGMLGGAMGLTLAALALWLVFTTTPLMVLLSAVDAMTQMVRTFNGVEQAIRLVLSTTHPVVAVIAWIFVTGWVAVLSTAWVCTVYRITFKGVTQK